MFIFFAISSTVPCCPEDINQARTAGSLHISLSNRDMCKPLKPRVPASGLFNSRTLRAMIVAAPIWLLYRPQINQSYLEVLLQALFIWAVYDLTLNLSYLDYVLSVITVQLFICSGSRPVFGKHEFIWGLIKQGSCSA